jgi:hypothetical protein
VDDRWSGAIVLLISSTRIGIRFLKLMALLGAGNGVLGHRFGEAYFWSLPRIGLQKGGRWFHIGRHTQSR